MTSLCIIHVYSNIWGIFILFYIACGTTFCLSSAPSVLSSRACIPLSWLDDFTWWGGTRPLQTVCHMWHGSPHWCLVLAFLSQLHKLLWTVSTTVCHNLRIFYWFVGLLYWVVLRSPLVTGHLTILKAVLCSSTCIVNWWTCKVILSLKLMHPMRLLVVFYLNTKVVDYNLLNAIAKRWLVIPTIMLLTSWNSWP